MTSFLLPGVKPWVRTSANEVANKFGLKSVGGLQARAYKSDHPLGLAVDLPCSTATGNAIAEYMIANATRLGVKYLIWRQRIWYAKSPEKGWKGMADRGSVSANHYDHVHASFISTAPPTGGDIIDGGATVNATNAAVSSNPLSNVDALGNAWALISSPGFAIRAGTMVGGAALLLFGIIRLVPIDDVLGMVK